MSREDSSNGSLGRSQLFIMASQFIICRGCLTACPRHQATNLSGSVKLENSASTTYQDIISIITGVKASETDMICVNCKKKAFEAYEFREKVRQTDKQLNCSDMKYDEEFTEDNGDDTFICEFDDIQTSTKQNQCLVCSDDFKSSMALVTHIRDKHPKVISSRAQKKANAKLGIKKEATIGARPSERNTRKSGCLKTCRIPIVNATQEEKIEISRMESCTGRSFYLPKRLVPKGKGGKKNRKVKIEDRIRCGICGRLFEKGSMLEDHCREHGATELIECALCYRMYLKYPHFKLHFNKHHAEMTNITQADTTETILDIQPDAVEICQYVRMTTITEVISRLVLLDADVTEPREIEVYVQVCGLCGAVLLSPEQLQEHNAKEHEDFDRRCYICTDELETPKLAKFHIAECKLKEFPYECHICLKKFRRERGMIDHVKAIHSHFYKGWIQARDTIRNYGCGICSKRFAFNHLLHRHATECAQRQGNTDYTCDECHKVFKSKIYLKRHIYNNHSSETKEKHLCSLCGATFKYRECLNRHTTTHTKEYRFHCAECNKGFATKHAYNYHMHRHTGQTPYVCEWPNCHKRFARPYSLRIHIRTHTGEKPNQCRYCDAAFRHNDALKKHLKTAHESETTDPGY